MDPVIVAEILEKSGKVHERIKLTALPATFGRGLDNDVILTDEFAAAHHARLDRDDAGELVLTDLNSENGLYILPALAPIQSHALSSDSLVRMGHTLVRLRLADTPVPPARTDTLTRSRLSALFTHSHSALIVGLLLVAMLAFNAYQTSLQKIQISRLLLETLEVLVIVPIWAGLWAILSRLFAHQAAYTAHAVIISLAIMGYYVFDTVVEYYAFAFSAHLSADVLFYLLFGLLTAMLIYAHLRFATLFNPKRIAGLAIGVSGGIMLLLVFATHVQELDFSDALPYPPEIKPPAFQVVKDQKLDDFLDKAGQLPRHLTESD